MLSKILFIPVSGPKGAGEYIRSLTIAQKIKEISPKTELHFILNKNAKYIKEVPFQAHFIDGSPTLNVKTIKKIISIEKPDLCIFDSGGRTTLFRFLKKNKIPIIYVSSRDNTRGKAFRLRWLKLIAQHWIVQPVFVNGHLTLPERVKIRITGSPSPVFLETVFPETDPIRRKTFKKEIGIDDHHYILFSSGGGGSRGDGEQAPDIFAKAAEMIAIQTNIKCVVIMGPNYPINPPKLPGVITIKSVTNYHFIDLIHDADFFVTGGGSTVAQGLANKKICITAPAAADQAKRIRAAANMGLVIPSNTDAQEISNKIMQLMNDQSLKKKIQFNVNRLNLNNGLSFIMDSIKIACPDKIKYSGKI